MAETKYIIFVLGQQKYSMRLYNINGIEQVYNLVPVPVGAEFIKGIIHLRNSVIPVYDLKERFGIDEEPDICNRQLLITETHGISMGFEVDDVIGIVSVPDENVKAVPEVVRSTETGYLESIIKVKFADSDAYEIMLSIAVDNLMSESEFDDVSNALQENQ